MPAVAEDFAGNLNDLTKNINGKDVCACNQILDAMARDLFYSPFDNEGRRALTGEINNEVYKKFVGFLSMQSSEDRSLGTGDELEGIISNFKK